MNSTVNKLIQTVERYFVFTRREAKAFLALLVSVLVIFMLYLLYFNFVPSRQPSAVDLLRADSASAAMQAKLFGSTNDIDAYPCFGFDPNAAPESAMTDCGMPEYLAKRIVKYRSKGGVFRKKEDLLRIYGFDSLLYSRLQTHILIHKAKTDLPPKKHVEPRNNAVSFSKKSFSKKEAIKINANTAEPEDWQRLKGIGTVLAARIVKYRDLLGGFVEPHQVKEVYGISDSVFAALRANIYIEPGYRPRTLSVFKDDFGTLLRHPYLKKDEVKCICKLRTSVLTPEVLLDSCKIELLQQLKPYLSAPEK